MEQVVAALIDLIKDQNKQILELSRLLADKPAWVAPEVQPSTVPLFSAPEEEDIEHMYKTGQISKETYHDMLSEAGFFTTEMVVPVPR